MSETGERIIEDHPNYQVVEVGGYVHYSDDLRRHLSRLSLDQRRRIVDEIEERARIRRFIRYKRDTVAIKFESENS